MLVQLQLQPDERQLRQFGFIALFAFGVLGGVVLWRNGLFGIDFGPRSEATAYALWAVGVVSALLSLIAPRANQPLFTALTLVAFPIGWLVSHFALALLFFGILTPVAIAFRICGRDALARAWDPDAKTYWTDLPDSTEPEDYFRQF